MSSRNTKPEYGVGLDTSHSLYSSLVGAWPFNEGSGNVVSGAINHVANTYNGTITWADNNFSAPAVGDYAQEEFSPISITNSGAFTVIAFVDKGTDYSNSSYVKLHGTDGISLIDLRTGYLDPPRMYVQDKNYNSTVFDGTTDITSNSPHVVALTFVPNTTGGAKLYVDGSIQTTADATSVTSIDVRYARFCESWLGELACALVFNTALSSTDIASLSSNPWQLWQAAATDIYCAWITA